MRLPSNCIIWAWWQFRKKGGWVHLRWTDMNKLRWIRWPHAYWEDPYGVWWEYTLLEKRRRIIVPLLFYGIVREKPG